MSIDCVVLAAGASSRFGQCKLLAPYNGRPLIAQALDCAAAINPARLLVVSGAYHEQLEQLDKTPWPQVELIHCADWHLGMGHSLAFAIKQLTQANAVMVLLADQALLTPADITALWHSWQASPERIVCAAFAQTIGVPAIFPAAFKAQLMQCRGDTGAKQIFNKHLNQVTAYPLPHAEFDIDTRADLIRAGQLTFGATL